MFRSEASRVIHDKSQHNAFSSIEIPADETQQRSDS
jgi:hypothetical protein